MICSKNIELKLWNCNSFVIILVTVFALNYCFLISFLGTNTNSSKSTNYIYEYDTIYILMPIWYLTKNVTEDRFKLLSFLPDKVSLLFPGQSKSIQGTKMNYLFNRLVDFICISRVKFLYLPWNSNSMILTINFHIILSFWLFNTFRNLQFYQIS